MYDFWKGLTTSNSSSEISLTFDTKSIDDEDEFICVNKYDIYRLIYADYLYRLQAFNQRSEFLKLLKTSHIHPTISGFFYD